jgi:hypothetical protein
MLVQHNGQHLVSSTRNLPSRSEHHGEIALISRTPAEGPGNWRNHSRQHNKGQPSMRGNDEQEVQQSTCQPRTNMVEGLKAKLHSRLAFTTLPRSTLGRRSMVAATRGVLSKQGEGTVLTGTTTMMTMTVSPPSPPTSPTNPIPTSSNKSESPSTTVSRTRTSGSDATPWPSRFQEDPTLAKISTFR